MCTYICCVYLYLLCVPISVVCTYICCVHLYLLCVPISVVCTYICCVCAYICCVCLYLVQVHILVSYVDELVWEFGKVLDQLARTSLLARSASEESIKEEQMTYFIEQVQSECKFSVSSQLVHMRLAQP